MRAHSAELDEAAIETFRAGLAEATPAAGAE